MTFVPVLCDRMRLIGASTSDRSKYACGNYNLNRNISRTRTHVIMLNITQTDANLSPMKSFGIQIIAVGTKIAQNTNYSNIIMMTISLKFPQYFPGTNELNPRTVCLSTSGALFCRTSRQHQHHERTNPPLTNKRLADLPTSLAKKIIAVLRYAWCVKWSIGTFFKVLLANSTLKNVIERRFFGATISATVIVTYIWLAITGLPRREHCAWSP